MPKLDNHRHEAFAQYLSEGCSADEAYERAGYKPNRFNASRLKTNEHILSRIEELQDRRRKMGDVTVESLTQELDAAVEDAKAAGQFGPVMTGLMGKAKLHGLITDKVKTETTIKSDPDDYSDEELAAIIEGSGGSPNAAPAQRPSKSDTLH